MKIIIIMCGLPRSGKSTIVEKLRNLDASFIKVSADDLRQYIYNHRFYDGGEEFVWGCRKAILKLLMSQNKKVVVDECNTTKSRRSMIIDIAKQYGYKTIIIYLSTPINTCLERADESLIPVINRMNSNIEIPDKSESDLIVTDNIDLFSLKIGGVI